MPYAQISKKTSRTKKVTSKDKGLAPVSSSARKSAKSQAAPKKPPSKRRARPSKPPLPRRARRRKPPLKSLPSKPATKASVTKKPTSKPSLQSTDAKRRATGKTQRKAVKISSKEAAKSVKKNVEPHALNDEMNEKVRELIHLSREQGFLTYKDVDTALPEIATQPEELQNVISIFNNLKSNFSIPPK